MASTKLVANARALPMNWLTKMFSGDHPAANLSEEMRARLNTWRALDDVPLDTTHHDTRYVIVNTEATNMDLNTGRVLAIAGIGVTNGIIAHRDAIEVGFDAPAEALVQILEFIGKSPVIVFNADFNRSVLMNAFEIHLGFEPDLEWIDAYWLLPSLFNDKHDRPVRLADWMKAMKIETFQRHRALGDAFAIAKLFLAAQSRANQRGHRSIRSIVDMAVSRKRLQRSISS